MRTMAAAGDERHPAEPQDEPDLLTLALVAYFVGLILVVAGLLILPALS